LLHRFATIRGTGNASAEFSVIPGEPTEGLNQVVRIDIPDDTNEIPTYNIEPPPDEIVPVKPTPETPPAKPEYTTYIPTISTPGPIEGRDENYLFDSLTAVTPMSPRNPLDPRGGKPDKEKKPGETPDELKEKSPGETPEALTEKAPKEKAADEVMESRVGSGEDRPEKEASQLVVGEGYIKGRSDQDRIMHQTLANGLLVGNFDGHGSKETGHRSAEFAKDNIRDQLALELADGKDIKEALRSTFLKLDEAIRKEEGTSGSDQGGATAAVAFIEGNKITVANVGDAEAFLLNASGQVLELTRRHLASDRQEQDRIRAVGGTIINMENADRVLDNNGQGGLMVTRALGDRSYGEYVSAEPTINEGTITADSQWFVVASDGLREAVDPQHLNTLLSEIVSEYPNFSSQEISDMLVKKIRTIAEQNHPDAIADIDDLSLQLIDLRGHVKKK